MVVLFVLIAIAVGICISIVAGYSLAARMFEKGPGRIVAAVLFTLLTVVALIAVVIAGCSVIFNR